MSHEVRRSLHEPLKWIRSEMVGRLEGVSEHDVRRPLTATGTNLLGLVKHLALWEARYLGEVFDRPFPGPLPPWQDEEANSAHLWVGADETRATVLEGYRRACEHADATIDALAIDARGQVAWWPRPEVTLADVLVHLVAETNRHAGHADILREQLDGTVGSDEGPVTDVTVLRDRADLVERIAAAARAAVPPPER